MRFMLIVRTRTHALVDSATGFHAVVSAQLDAMARAGVLLASSDLPLSNAMAPDAARGSVAQREDTDIALCALIDVRSTEEAAAWGMRFSFADMPEQMTSVDIRQMLLPGAMPGTTLH